MMECHEIALFEDNYEQGDELGPILNNAEVGMDKRCSADDEKVQGIEREHDWKAVVKQNAEQENNCEMSRGNEEMDETDPEQRTTVTSEYHNNRNQKLCHVISGVALLSLVYLKGAVAWRVEV